MDLEQKRRKLQPDRPVHKPKESLLSSGSGYTNYRGLLNLCFIILVLSNARVALENIIKYGILVEPLQWVFLLCNLPNIIPFFKLLLALNFFILSSLFLERSLLVPRKISDRAGAATAAGIILTLLSLPPLVFRSGQCNPVGASVCCLVYSIMSLKLTSYHMVNYWCRKQQYSRTRRNSMITNGGHHSAHNGTSNSNGHGNGDASRHQPAPLVEYPNNLTIPDLAYFIAAPTLCYELNFPRTDRIRKRFILKRLFEIVFLFQLDIGLIQQWMVPTIRNSLEPFKEMSLGRMLERLLKLAVPNHLIWLIFFYWFFHAFLNLLAELLRFSDRQFYKDWWNSESVSTFWSTWNIPVHAHLVRHVYLPLLNQDRVKFNRFWASTVVFLLSAFYHEYLVSVPLNMFRLWAFGGMIAQLPLSVFVNRYLKGQSGNVAVWISLILGQPLCILMYYHDYYVIHVASTSN